VDPDGYSHDGIADTGLLRSRHRQLDDHEPCLPRPKDAEADRSHQSTRGFKQVNVGDDIPLAVKATSGSYCSRCRSPSRVRRTDVCAGCRRGKEPHQPRIRDPGPHSAVGRSATISMVSSSASSVTIAHPAGYPEISMPTLPTEPTRATHENRNLLPVLQRHPPSVV
jgi:hypothetical protein